MQCLLQIVRHSRARLACQPNKPFKRQRVIEGQRQLAFLYLLFLVSKTTKKRANDVSAEIRPGDNIINPLLMIALAFPVKPRISFMLRGSLGGFNITAPMIVHRMAALPPFLPTGSAFCQQQHFSPWRRLLSDIKIQVLVTEMKVKSRQINKSFLRLHIGHLRTGAGHLAYLKPLCNATTHCCISRTRDKFPHT